MDRTRRRRTRLVIGIAAVVIVLGALITGAKVVWDRVTTHGIAESCTVATFTLTPAQAAVAAQMTGVVLRRSLPQRAAVLVLAAALQESKLTDLALGDGDRDSVGVLQQRPSQGWGTATQLADIHYATGAFLDRLLTVTDWQTRPLTEVVQEIQVSAYPDAYAQQEPEAQALADALFGTVPRSLSCTYPTPTQVAAATSVASVLSTDLPVNTPVAEANTVHVPGAGWATAGYLVANGDRFGLDQVAYDGQLWTRTKGWKPEASAGASAVVATLHG